MSYYTSFIKQVSEYSWDLCLGIRIEGTLSSSSSTNLSLSSNLVESVSSTTNDSAADTSNPLKIHKVVKRRLQRIKSGETVAFVCQVDGIGTPKPVVAAMQTSIVEPHWLCNSILIVEESPVSFGQPLLTLKLCSHPVQIDGGLCAECGAKITQAMISANAQPQTDPVRRRR